VGLIDWKRKRLKKGFEEGIECILAIIGLNLENSFALVLQGNVDTA